MTSDGSIEIAVVGAIRLALEGSDSDKVVVQIVRELVKEAVETPHDDTASVILFLDTVRKLGGTFRVPEQLVSVARDYGEIFDVVGVRISPMAVDLVTVSWADDWERAGRKADWMRLLLEDGQSAFNAARRVRQQVVPRLDWGRVRLASVEIPLDDMEVAGALIAGSLIGAFPHGVVVAPTWPGEWRTAVIGDEHASDERVLSWCRRREVPDEWPVGACEALMIAIAACQLNQEGIEQAKAALRMSE